MPTTDKPRRKLNHLFRNARLEQGLTSNALAKAVGTTKVSVSRWEHGISKPSPLFCKKLLEALKKRTIQELGFDLEDKEQEPGQSLQVDDVAPRESFLQKPSIWNVPHRNPFFTGREDILERLHGVLTGTQERQPPRPVAIIGLGGVGKTQAAIEYAWRHRSDFLVVCWLKADNGDLLAAEFVRIAQMLNLSEASSSDQLQAIAAFRTWMQEQSRWLLILDNVEMPEALLDFLPEEPRGHILMTSRAQALGMIAQKIDLSSMEPGEGAWFLLRRTQKVALDSSLDAASLPDQQQARAISEDLGGLPLALEQAGAYIEETGCSHESYRERYRDQHAELLTRRGTLSDPEYPKSVATTWILSFTRVKQNNPGAAELLYFLAFLNPDAVPLSLVRDAAPRLPRHLRRAAGNAVKLDGAIGDLRRFSLVQRHAENEMPVSGETLSIHPLVQTVLKDAMPAQMQRQWAERTVKAVHRAFSVRYYIAQAQACAALIEQWELHSKEAADLLYQAGCQAQERQMNRVAGLLFQQALPICERVCKTTRLPVVRCLIRIAQVYQARQKYEEAESHYRGALDIRRRLRGSAHPTVAWCKFALGQLYAQQRKYTEAEAVYQELAARSPKDVALLEARAVLSAEQERYAEAEALIQQELAVLRSVLEPKPLEYLKVTGSRTPELADEFVILEPTSLEYLKVTAVIYYLAELYLKQGKTAEAETLIQQELATLGSVLEPTDYRIMTMSEHLVDIYRQQGRRDDAEALLRQLIHFRQQSPEKDAKEDVPIARNLLSLAEVLVGKDAHEAAEGCYRQALVIVDEREWQERAFLLKLLMSYASFLLLMERTEEAEQLAARADTLYEEIQSQNAFWKGLSHYLNEGEILGDDAMDSPS